MARSGRTDTVPFMSDASGAIDPIAEARRQWVAHGLAEPLSMAAATSILRAQQLVTTAVR